MFLDSLMLGRKSSLVESIENFVFSDVPLCWKEWFGMGGFLED